MAILNGVKSSAVIEVLYDPYTSSNLTTARTYYDGEALADAAGDFSDVFSSQPYADPFSTGHAGVKSADFGDDWYDRIHVSPNELALGNLVSTQVRKVVVWNAFLVPKDFTAFSVSNTTGITVEEESGVVPPTTLKELQILTYDVTVDLDGPPTISSLLTWTIDGQEYTALITGRRVVLFGFKPNWREPVKEIIEYKSTVTRSFGGDEQRASLRKKPRRIYEYSLQAHRREAQLLDNLLFGWQHRLFALPAWPEATSLQNDVSSGDTVIECDVSNRTFVVGGLVAVFQDAFTADVREIASVIGDTVTLTASLSQDWAAGTRVYPVFVAAINENTRGRRPSDGSVQMPVRFACEPRTTDANLPGTPAPLTHQGVELFLDGANWADGFDFTWESDREINDFGTGAFNLVEKADFAKSSRGHNWTLRTLAEVLDFRGWLERREGRAKPVYMPTFFDDFTLVEDTLLSAATSLDVLPNGYDTLVDAHSARRDIVLLLRDGTAVARRVVSVSTTVDGNLRLALDASFGQDILKSQIKRLCVLGLYRLGSDSVTLNWLTRGVVETATTVVATKTG